MLSFQFQYQALFVLSFKHAFFEDNGLKSYDILPEGNTPQELKKLGMLFKRTEEGFVILVDQLDPDQLYLRLEKLLGKRLKLRFILYTRDAFFFNYTKLPFNQQKIFFLTNEQTQGLSGSLHGGESVSEVEQFPISDRLSDAVFPKNKGGIALACIELLFTDKLLQELMQSLLDQSFKTYSYQVQFASRSVKWRYVICTDQAKKLQNLQITGDADIRFSKGKKELIQQKEVLVFTSEKEINYQQFYDYTFKLKRGSAESGGKILKKKLQYAPFDLLRPAGDKDKFLADILVYI